MFRPGQGGCGLLGRAEVRAGVRGGRRRCGLVPLHGPLSRDRSVSRGGRGTGRLFL